MKVLYRNQGKYPAYSLDGSVLSLRGGELTLNLAALAQDDPIRLVISATRDGKFILGTGWRYVAELELPAKNFVLEKIGYTDDFGYPALRKAYLPYNAENAVLTLWAEKEER